MYSLLYVSVCENYRAFCFSVMLLLTRCQCWCYRPFVSLRGAAEIHRLIKHSLFRPMCTLLRYQTHTHPCFLYLRFISISAPFWVRIVLSFYVWSYVPSPAATCVPCYIASCQQIISLSNHVSHEKK